MTDPNAPHRSDANVEPSREHVTHEPEATAECAESSPEAPQNIVPPWLRPTTVVEFDARNGRLLGARRKP